MINEKVKGESLKRLNKIEGQVRGVRGMVEENAPALEILTQIQAVRSALAAVGRHVLQDYLEETFSKVRRGSRPEVERTTRVIKLLMD